jgi:hypothetical protein
LSRYTDSMRAILYLTPTMLPGKELAKTYKRTSTH